MYAIGCLRLSLSQMSMIPHLWVPRRESPCLSGNPLFHCSCEFSSNHLPARQRSETTTCEKQRKYLVIIRNCARIGADQVSECPSTPRVQLFLTFSALASTTISPLIPSRPQAQDTRTNFAVSASLFPSLPSVPLLSSSSSSFWHDDQPSRCMRTAHLPFRVSRKCWKATSHNPLIMNPIAVDAVIFFGLRTITDAWGVCSRGGVVFYRW